MGVGNQPDAAWPLALENVGIEAVETAKCTQDYSSARGRLGIGVGPVLPCSPDRVVRPNSAMAQVLVVSAAEAEQDTASDNAVKRIR